MERLKSAQREGPRPPTPRARIPKKAQGVPPIQPVPLVGRPVRPASQEMGRGKPGKGHSYLDPLWFNPVPKPRVQGAPPPPPHHLHLPLLRLVRHHGGSQSKRKKMSGRQLRKNSPWPRLQRPKPPMMRTTSVLLQKTRRISRPRCFRRPSTTKRTPSLSIARRSRSSRKVTSLSVLISAF